MTTPVQTAPQIEEVHCNTCAGLRRHEVVAKREQNGSDVHEGYPLRWRTTWTMLQCAGCSTVCLRRLYWFSEWDESLIEFYPPPMSRQLPNWVQELAEGEADLLREVYVAVQSDCRRIGAMGARTLVDMVINRESDQGSFTAGLEALVTRGLIGSVHKEVLNAALENGHAAAHRGYKPSREKLNQVLDIVEHLLHTEILQRFPDRLLDGVPPRPARRLRHT